MWALRKERAGDDGEEMQVAGEDGVWAVQGQEVEAKNQTVGCDFASC